MNSAICPDISHFRSMLKIRTIEKLLLSEFSKGGIRGTTHTYIGQEAIAVAALSYLEEQDIVVSNHRSHGHFISYCNQHENLLEEIKGTERGVCKGLGGSQHLYYKNFYSNGIQGGMVPVATGMALAEKLKMQNSIAISFIGDGTMGQGIIYESFNMASLWRVPVMFIVENNQYAQSTPMSLNLSGSIFSRLKAFNIEANEIESNDIQELLVCFHKAFTYVRSEQKPFCQIINTYRLGPHSKGDDDREESEIKSWKERDPLILAKKYFDMSTIANIEKKQISEIENSFRNIFDQNGPDVQKTIIETDDNLIPIIEREDYGTYNEDIGKLMVNCINEVLHKLFSKDERFCLIGEDLLDPYGGAFKITKGLSTKYKERVLSSPISEPGLVGIANGMALRGLKPIVEIMFGDFTTLIIDQVLNHATKFSRMYGNKVKCPIIIRTPMGGYRGYGPTHSQSLEKLFFGIPGLAVIACDPIHNQKLIWDQMIKLESPVIYIENKSLYGQKLKLKIEGKIDNFFVKASTSFFPTSSLKLTSFNESTDVILLAYGGMLPLAMDVAKKVFIEEEIVVEIVAPSLLSPIPKEEILKAIESCKRIVVIEEGSGRNGWAAEISLLVAENISEKFIFRSYSAKESIIPNSKAGERFVLPDAQSCYDLIMEIVDVN
jgi:2-oxoisovalerate dehydrogenase E1 component